ncbi:hypothetical protein [Streptomyces sp. NBC_01429]|uniref:hypothetical protein n=1 Tax=Streptomyces sp. NBC_01429 TaxID=2903862 RepID=UPI002E2B160C|nr:hypothetical protein [Streptomyces sp. NBC_01429]
MISLPNRRRILLETALTSLTTAILLISLAYGATVDTKHPPALDPRHSRPEGR